MNTRGTDWLPGDPLPWPRTARIAGRAFLWGGFLLMVAVSLAYAGVF